jgi:phosphatidylserine/phosphatidylglycerophosphate/cardiolipin synthase-like enzyme
VKLIIQPQDGVKPLIEGIDKARKSIEIAIFRFDRREVEWALESAVKRGVFVHTLIADTNRNGEKNLRKLEMRLLAKGVTVARTSDDLVRYHGKFMIIDRKDLYLLAFNFTHLDIDRSRSFGLITKNRQLVEEAARLFEADTKRQPYAPKSRNFLVSPLNARPQLAAFIKGAKRQLLIYDSKISDQAMIRLLTERAKNGVELRIIGRISAKNASLAARKLAHTRLHTRTIIRDNHQMFLGSQSLRELELDARREIGVIISDSKVVNAVTRVFEEDWNSAEATKVEAPPKESMAVPLGKAATRTAAAVAEGLPPIAPIVEQAIKQVIGKSSGAELDHKNVQATVKGAVTEAVKAAVTDIVEELVEQGSGKGK